MILWNRWKFLLNFQLPTLVPMNSDGEACSKNTSNNTSNNSNNYLTNWSYPNFALMLVWKLSEEDNILSHLMQEDQAVMVHLWREYRMSRNDPRTRARGWIVGIRKLAPISVSRQNRFLGSNCEWSWKVRVRDIETIEDERHRAFGKPVAKARPPMKSTITLTPVAVPLRERKWVDVNPGSYDHGCYALSKAMIRLPRDDHNIHRETEGAVKHEGIVEEFNKKE